MKQTLFQIYLNALIFASARSKVQNEFQIWKLYWIKKLFNIKQNWNILLQTLEKHTNLMRAIIFSKNEKMLTSASDDHMIQLWNSIIRQCLQTHKKHTDWMWAIVFSKNEKMLTSALIDHMIQLWNLIIKQCLQTLKKHTDWVRNLLFSKNNCYLNTN